MITSTRLSIMLTAVYLTLFGLINPAFGKNIRVSKRESIQAAINSARNGDRIIVEEEKYPEQLLITTNDISLIGRNAVLVPPPAPVSNLCTGLAGKIPPANTIETQAGICIAGPDVQLAEFVKEHKKVSTVGRRVKGVSVTGFTVQGFLGLNIAVVGARDTSITDNTLTDGAFYGALTVGSINTEIKRNTVNSSPPTPANTFMPFIGVCMDDVITVTITRNGISGYLIGLCVQTDGANIHDNEVSNCCIGSFVDPGIKGAKLRDNTIRDTNPRCFDSATSGSFLISGIYIGGAQGTILNGNKVTGITAGGNTVFGGAGIAVNDDFPAPFGTAAVASENRVRENITKRNDLDIQVLATGQGNVVKDNRCQTSLPAEVCANSN